jgi:hypothetical protein
LIPALVVLALLPTVARAQVEWGNFGAYGTRQNVEAYAKDLGAIMGSGTFHTGRGLGFPGFDIGFHYAYQFAPDSKNTVMKQSGIQRFGMPWFEADIGMPLKLDGFIRGFSWEGLTVAGGGLRYALFTIQDLKGVPQVMIVTDGESFVHKDFRGTHFGANLVASANYEYFRPYVGVGVDDTRFVPAQAALDPTMIDQSFEEFGTRLTAGVSIRPAAFTYLALAGALRNGNTGVEASAGLRF